MSPTLVSESWGVPLVSETPGVHRDSLVSPEVSGNPQVDSVLPTIRSRRLSWTEDSV